MRRETLCWLLILFVVPGMLPAEAGDLAAKYEKYGDLLIRELQTAPFPHPERAEGHDYRGEHYPAELNYADRSVFIFVPHGLEWKNRTDFVVHFHGWWNEIDSVVQTFELIEQLVASRRNAVLLIPQGPKNAPDSFGGKLEDRNGFRDFMCEIQSIIAAQYPQAGKKIGTIVLSGHSGGYHVIANILLQGGLQEHISDVLLFDGFYGQFEKYLYWMEHSQGRFVHVFTESGGTKENSIDFMNSLAAWQLPFLYVHEELLTLQDLAANAIIFIYSDLSHNEVIHRKSQFRRYLESSALEAMAP